MKKLILSFAVLSLLSFGLVSWKANDPSVVINDFGCGMFDGNGNFVFTDNSHAVINNNGNGMIRCQAQVSNTTGAAVEYSGFLCNTPSGFTNTTHENVSASGHATLICTVNAQ